MKKQAKKKHRDPNHEARKEATKRKEAAKRKDGKGKIRKAAADAARKPKKAS